MIELALLAQQGQRLNFLMRLSVSFIVPSIVLRVTTNQVITWTGSQKNFSSFGTNPDLSKSEWTTKLLTLVETLCYPSLTVIKENSNRDALAPPRLL